VPLNIRTRPRPRLHGGGGAERIAQGAAAARLPHGVDRRIRGAGRGAEAAGDHRAAEPPAHLYVALFARCGRACWRCRNPVRGLRRHGLTVAGLNF
jgi:hypothetical protein